MGAMAGSWLGVHRARGDPKSRLGGGRPGCLTLAGGPCCASVPGHQLLSSCWTVVTSLVAQVGERAWEKERRLSSPSGVAAYGRWPVSPRASQQVVGWDRAPDILS